MIFNSQSARRTSAAYALLALSIPAFAAKKKDPPPADTLQVLAQVSIEGRTASRLILGNESDKNLLYIASPKAHSLVVIDVTDSKAPKLVRQRTDVDSDNIPSEVMGTVALQASDDASTADHSPETVTITSIADVQHPRTIRKFEGVTGKVLDQSRNLIYILNAEGLWILHWQTAQEQQIYAQVMRNIEYNR